MTALAEALTETGVQAVFGIPGSGPSLQLISILEQREVPFYVTAHEASAAMMAGAFGRESGGFGCSLSIKGPGLANMLAGMTSNAYESLPVLSIAEAYPHEATPLRMHKRLDHRQATSWCAKAYATLGEPRSTIEQLTIYACEEIPGPVHLDISANDSPAILLRNTLKTEENLPDERSDILHQVSQAQRPVVIVGSLACRSDWGKRLLALRIPVFTTLAAKGIMDETQPYAAGVFTGDGQQRSPEVGIISQSDLVIGLGLRSLEVLSPRPFAAPSIIVDNIGIRFSQGFQPKHFWRVEAPKDFNILLDALSDKTWGRESIVEAMQQLRRFLTADSWLPGVVFVELERLLPQGSCLATDTGWFCTVAEHIWRARSTQAFFASANGRFMGTAIPSAIGIALANRHHPVICAMGDGGIRPYVADVKLAIEESLPILFLLLTDGRFGSIAGVPSAQGLSQRATTLRFPSWFQAIESLGCPSAQVRDLESFTEIVRKWKWQEGPLFIEAVFDPERYAKMLEGVR